MVVRARRGAGAGGGGGRWLGPDLDEDGLVEVVGSARSCSKNQCWIGVRGASPVTAPWAATTMAPLPSTAASSATVWCWKSCWA